jgi:hypothetical protein
MDRVLSRWLCYVIHWKDSSLQSARNLRDLCWIAINKTKAAGTQPDRCRAEDTALNTPGEDAPLAHPMSP